jgi:hypothetical protein
LVLDVQRKRRAAPPAPSPGIAPKHDFEDPILHLEHAL